MNNDICKRIKMNFEKDIRDQMIKLLRENCEKNFNKENTTLELIINYLNSVNRRIYPKSREILKSDRILKIINTNTIDGKCSEKEIKAIDVLREFEEKFKNGEDMNGHLSKNIYNSNLFNADGGATKDWKSRDYLLDDWGIHHIHLNIKEAFNKREMSNNRAEYLLFIKATNEAIYFIDIKGHRTDNFNDIELLRIMDRNWPYLLSDRPLNIKFTDEFNCKDIKDIRKKHGFAIYNINGKVYFPPGGGLSSAGSNIKHINQAETILLTIREFEKYIIEHCDEIREELGRYDDILEFKIECTEHFNILSGYKIIELNTGIEMIV